MDAKTVLHRLHLKDDPEAERIVTKYLGPDSTTFPSATALRPYLRHSRPRTPPPPSPPMNKTLYRTRVGGYSYDQSAMTDPGLRKLYYGYEDPRAVYMSGSWLFGRAERAEVDDLDEAMRRYIESMHKLSGQIEKL